MIGLQTLVEGSVRLGVGAGREALRPMAYAVTTGRRVSAQLVLDGLDALLGSALAEIAADRVLASPWTERTIAKALTGPVVEVLDTDAIEQVLDRAEAAGAVQRLADRVLGGPETSSAWWRSRWTARRWSAR